jgi:uncharacterized protein
MDDKIILEIKNLLKISEKQIKAVLDLLHEGSTVQFIARYRKEVTGALDEVQINEINKAYEYQKSLFERKEQVMRLIDEKGMLTDELKQQLIDAEKLVDVEDIYRPFKEKKKTKASEAIANGLQGLADFILSFPKGSVVLEANNYLNEKILTTGDAITGAKYIIAESISDNAEYRKYLRSDLFLNGEVVTLLKKGGDLIDTKKTYEQYYSYREYISDIKPHRVLAINRAEDEKVIIVKLETEKEYMLEFLEKRVITNTNNDEVVSLFKEAISDSLDRLIYPSLERDIRGELSEKAEEQAIVVFGDNLQKLLLQPPLIGKMVLGVDPAFRTGCKLTVIDSNGKFLEKGKIYPHEKRIGAIADADEVKQSVNTVVTLVRKYKIDIIAIGNGTASRETERFIADIINEYFKDKVKYVIVSEAGASVYSASELAREEFPDFSVEERSAASIARRIQDPLSELVKIDPKSIGVGQYQHDVTPKKLEESLNFVVTSAVNSVGVDVNTASKALLTYVSGLSKGIAENIVKYRESKGKFKSREDLKNVPKFGPKAYEQAIGFLRVKEGTEPLDITSIHPESYSIAKTIMKQFKITPDLFGKQEVRELINLIDRKALAKELSIDAYTLNDILDAFIAPIRDPRDEYPQPILKSDIVDLDSLVEGMELEGTVRNVTDFGAFVDIGLHNDGLVHISKMSNKRINHPREVVKVGDIVVVYVISIDKQKEKVGLSLIKYETAKK